jgi:RimJ/RimL family protein N-acetyltransferase
MMMETTHLVLRSWKEGDKEPFARMNADPHVMEFMPNRLTAAECNSWVDWIKDHFARHGFGLYAAELKSDGRFIGFIGVQVPSFQAHFTPCVEIGWRLAADCWGKGLATEGASAVGRHAFDVLRLASLVSFTVPANIRSRRVMEKLGMNRNPTEDFDHPKLPEGHPFRRHVLYRLARAD